MGTEWRVKIDSKIFKNLYTIYNKHGFSVLIDRNSGISSLNKKENLVATFSNHSSHRTGLGATGAGDSAPQNLPPLLCQATLD